MLYFVAELLLALGEAIEFQHMAVVRVVGASLAVLIALVDTWHARDGEVDDLKQHSCFVCLLLFLWVAVCGHANLALPTSSLIVLIPAHSATCERDEAALVVVARYITHGVVRTIRSE